MDWLDFIASVIKSLASLAVPASITIIVLALAKRFEPEIKSLSGRMTDAKAGALAFGFAHTEDLVEAAQKSVAPPPGEVTSAAPRPAPDVADPDESDQEPDDKPMVVEPGATAQAAVALAEQSADRDTWRRTSGFVTDVGTRSAVDLVLKSWDYLYDSISKSSYRAGLLPFTKHGHSYENHLEQLLANGIVESNDYAAIRSLDSLRSAILDGRAISYAGSAGADAYRDLAVQMAQIVTKKTDEYLVGHVKLSTEQTPE